MLGLTPLALDELFLTAAMSRGPEPNDERSRPDVEGLRAVNVSNDDVSDTRYDVQGRVDLGVTTESA